MKLHYKERLEDVLHWSWKLFCRLWADLIDYAEAEEQRRQKEQHERAIREMRGQQGNVGGW